MNGAMPHIDDQSGVADARVDPPSTDLLALGFWGRLKWAFLGQLRDVKSTAYLGSRGENTSLGIWNLRQLRVEDVMVPKADIKSVPVTIAKEDLVNVFRDSGLTRLPVYNGTLDTPSGFVHLKDIALKHGFNGSGCRLALQTMLRPLLFVPPSMPIGVLLAKMQADRIHMALVVDEYGGTDGLVTIEDLIEQVIGEIEDEHDVDEEEIVRISEGLYSADAKVEIEEFIEFFELKIDPMGVDAETLGGFIISQFGILPSVGDKLKVENLNIEVTHADKRKIDKVSITKT